MADEVEEIIEEKPKGSKLKIILGVVGLIVLLIAVVFATLFFSGYFNPKPEIDPEQAAAAADVLNRALERQNEREFLVNLSSSKKVMSVQLAVMTHYDERVFENVKKHDFALRSVIMDVMRQTQEADIVKPEFRKELAQKIRDSMNTLLEKYEDFGGIEEVHFTNFIVQ